LLEQLDLSGLCREGENVSTEEGRRRLQRYLSDEVDRRGMTWVALGGEVGDSSSVSTIRSYVQSGVAERPHRSTLAVVDRLLGWERGSARAVLDGGAPTPAGSPPGSPAGSPAGETTDEAPALAGAKWDRLSAEQQQAVLNVIDSMLDPS
jgi:hypothetical protein